MDKVQETIANGDSRIKTVSLTFMFAIIAIVGFRECYIRYDNAPNLNAALSALKWQLIIGATVGLFLGVIVVSIALANENNRRFLLAAPFLLLFHMLYAPALLLGAKIALVAMWHWSFGYMSNTLPKSWFQIVGVIILGITVALLFLFRLKARACYGVTEVLFAAYVGWVQLSQVGAESFNFAKSISLAPVLLSGCIYLAVRGCDNIHQGYEVDKLLERVLNIPRNIITKRFGPRVASTA